MLSGAQDSSFSTFLERDSYGLFNRRKEVERGEKGRMMSAGVRPGVCSPSLFFSTRGNSIRKRITFTFLCVPPSRFINATCWSKPKRRLLFFKRQMSIRPLNTWIDRNDVTLFEWLIKRRNLFSHSQGLPKKNKSISSDTILFSPILDISI